MGAGIFLFLFAFGIFSPSNCFPTYVNWTSSDWLDAQQSCFQSGGRLYEASSLEDFENLTKLVNISTTTSYWLGGKERRNFFVWNIDQTKLIPDEVGCFTYHPNLDKKFVENQPALCISYCKNYMKMPFAGLSKNKCICYPNINGTVQRQVVDRKCNSTCPGDSFYNCGSEETTTVYSTEETIKWKLFEPGNANTREDCVLFTKDAFNESVWLQDRCRNEYRYICRIYDETICKFKNQKTPCNFMSLERAPWFEAVRKCASMRGHLAGKDLTDDNDVILDSSSFWWTSLTRIRQNWMNGNKVDDLIPKSEEFKPRRTGCLSLRHDGTKWTIEAWSCRQYLPFICKLDTQTFLTAENIKQIDQDFYFYELIGIMVGVSSLCVLIGIGRCISMKDNRTGPSNENHFYFVLEKESVYNTISLNTTVNHVQTRQNHNSNETYYDRLAFEGTVQYADRQRAVEGTGQVDYCVYNMAIDVTKDYEKLHFKSTKKEACFSSENYCRVKKSSDGSRAELNLPKVSLKIEEQGNNNNCEYATVVKKSLQKQIDVGLP